MIVVVFDMNFDSGSLSVKFFCTKTIIYVYFSTSLKLFAVFSVYVIYIDDKSCMFMFKIILDFDQKRRSFTKYRINR